ncbi:MAG: hypothetical protein A2031_08215 [Deltaproteobacteria bacterium RBG_19FT_COMBO_43_11]|nr:MAG: hypothetical protein A2W27_08255 [Deltaproteobacteria bacterium RBG_16_44_11]OGP87180.1 MAG: hypothetical protein A2031_08215 [Deltaproteobacteria bacterium RBG_19FT_COMBO_43_11]
MCAIINPSLKEKVQAKNLNEYLKPGAGVNRRARRYHARNLIKTELEKPRPREKVKIVFTEMKKEVPLEKAPQSMMSKIKTIFGKET